MSNSPPPTPNYGDITRQTLGAQVDLAPQEFHAEAQFSPQYTGLEVNNLGTAANGLNSLLTGGRASGVSDLESLGPAAASAITNANPAQAQLLGGLNASANTGLAAGSGLTPDQATAMQQASRAGYAARGLTNSNSSVLDELLRQFNLGQNLLTQRQNFAQGVAQTNNSTVNNPLYSLLMGTPSSVSMAPGVVSGAGPSLFNPQAGIGLAQSNYATQSQFAAAQPTGFQDGVAAVNALGNLVGGFTGGGK
jgi:hypothetical protein